MLTKSTERCWSSLPPMNIRPYNYFIYLLYDGHNFYFRCCARYPCHDNTTSILHLSISGNGSNVCLHPYCHASCFQLDSFLHIFCSQCAEQPQPLQSLIHEEFCFGIANVCCDHFMKSYHPQPIFG